MENTEIWLVSIKKIVWDFKGGNFSFYTVNINILNWSVY